VTWRCRDPISRDPDLFEEISQFMQPNSKDGIKVALWGAVGAMLLLTAMFVAFE
jgi:hypothetical protein